VSWIWEIDLASRETPTFVTRYDIKRWADKQAVKWDARRTRDPSEPHSVTPRRPRSIEGKKSRGSLRRWRIGRPSGADTPNVSLSRKALPGGGKSLSQIANY
jgi:hypothetical protein